MIIFEDDENIVAFNNNGGDLLIITFAHMDFRSSSGNYWGSIPLNKMGVSSLGIVGKRNVWYPPSLMKSAIPFVRHVIKSFKTVLVYGFSMGGYGALKYSKTFNAKTVIALSPQVSLDPQDDKNGILGTFYDKNLHKGTGIKPDDLQGNIFICYDPYHENDNASANYIKSIFPDTSLLPAPRAQHETIDLFAGTGNLKILIGLCLNKDVLSLKKFIHRRRREAWRRIETILSYAIHKNQEYGWKLANNIKHESKDFILERLKAKHDVSVKKHAV